MFRFIIAEHLLTTSASKGVSIAAQAWRGRGASIADTVRLPESDAYGSDRPGALIAGTWAAMQYMGQE